MSDDLDPYAHFLCYVAIHDQRFPFHTQLFLTSRGSIPTLHWFLQRLHVYPLPSYSGQSMWAGGATWLASIGTPPNVIQALGRWSLDTWRRYICQHPLILHHLT